MSKETVVVTHFYQGHGRHLSCSGFLSCQGTLLNQSETMKTLKGLSGTSIMAKKSAIMAKKGVFKEDSSLDALFRVMQYIQGVLGLSGILLNNRR